MAFVPNVRNVRLFLNTGFDKDNPPASPSILSQFNYVDVPPINALQMSRLTSVCVRATEDQVENADYCYISDGTKYFYYAVLDYHMEKPDTCTLFIDMAYILSAGGIASNSWDIIDGITERHHVATADDTLFAYVEEDPLLIPSKPLEIVYKKCINNQPSSSDYVVIEATIDLYDLAHNTPDAIAYETQNGEQCVVPKVPKLSGNSGATMMINPDDITEVETTVNPATAYYDGTNTDIKEGLARARALGIESGSIIAQVVIPVHCATRGTVSNGFINSLNGTIETVVAMQNPEYSYVYGTAQNKRVYAGICNKYGILAVGSGNSVEFNPEDLYHSGDTSPNVIQLTDPRPSGRPYFRFEYYKNSKSNFFLNCIAGLNWQNVPLVYTDKSGSEIDTVKFKTELSMMEANTRLQTEAMKGKMYSEAVGQGLNIAMKAGLTTDGDMRAGRGLVSQAAGMAFDQVSGAINDYYTLKNMQDKLFYEEAQKAQDFYISQRIVTPQLNFPRSESLRDFLGNGCYAYRYYLASSDIAKFDKILNMYGYRVTEPLTKAMLNVRSKFNYVKAGNVSIGGSLPKWFREGIAKELSTGKRFWKVAVDKSYYTNGGNT